MKISSRFMRGLVSKVINNMVKKKMGYEVDVQLNELNATIIDGTAHVHLNVDAEMGKDEFKKLLRRIGLDA